MVSSSEEEKCQDSTQSTVLCIMHYIFNFPLGNEALIYLYMCPFPGCKSNQKPSFCVCTQMFQCPPNKSFIWNILCPTACFAYPTLAVYQVTCKEVYPVNIVEDNADFGEIVTGVQGGEDCHPQFICPQISHPYSDISSQARGRGIFTGEVKAPKQNVDGFYGTESYREVDNCRDINDDCCDEPVFESMECMDSFAGKPLYPLFTYGFSEEGVMVTGVMNDIPSEEPTPHLPESPNQPLPAVARSFFPWIRPSFFYLRKAIKRTEKLFEPLMNRIFRPLKRPGYPFPSLDLPLKTSSQQPQGQGSSSLPTPARVLPAWLRELMAAKQTNWPDPPENYHKIVKWMYAGVGFNGPGKLMNFGSSPIVG
ncbi:hypothetical protein GBAR_LOCUS2660 [Geodia barretti]|nr:hypothetical protein GBAR_LOCUS2660 [Geodia barretti]